MPALTGRRSCPTGRPCRERSRGAAVAVPRSPPIRRRRFQWWWAGPAKPANRRGLGGATVERVLEALPRAEYTEQREHGRDAQACQQPLLRHDESKALCGRWECESGGAQYDAGKFEIAPCWYFVLALLILISGRNQNKEK